LIIYEYMMPKFPSEYIFSTIIIAIFTYTILGTYIAFTIVFDFSLEKGSHAYIQTHIFFLFSYMIVIYIRILLSCYKVIIDAIRDITK